MLIYWPKIFIMDMKKLMFIALMGLGICLSAGCGNKTANGEEIDSVSSDTLVVVDSVSVDSICLD